MPNFVLKCKNIEIHDQVFNEAAINEGYLRTTISMSCVNIGDPVRVDGGGLFCNPSNISDSDEEVLFELSFVKGNGIEPNEWINTIRFYGAYDLDPPFFSAAVGIRDEVFNELLSNIKNKIIPMSITINVPEVGTENQIYTFGAGNIMIWKKADQKSNFLQIRSINFMYSF